MYTELKDQLSQLLYMGKCMSAQKCEMMYYWQHHLHLQHKHTPDYLTFGSVFHKAALELGLNFGFDVAEAILQHRLDLAKTLGWKQDDKVARLFADVSEADRNLMLIMLDAFAVKIKEAGITQILGVEKTVKYPIVSPYFTDWCIKIDFLFQDMEGVWAGDLKTTSGYGPATARYYHSSPQTKTYFHIAKKLMPNLRGTKIFVVTKQKVRCEIETILLNNADHYEAELFMEESIKHLNSIETEYKMYQTPFQRHMSHCINFLGQECPYIPICVKPITSQSYLDDLLHNWYTISNPDDHLELD